MTIIEDAHQNDPLAAKVWEGAIIQGSQLPSTKLSIESTDGDGWETVRNLFCIDSSLPVDDVIAMQLSAYGQALAADIQSRFPKGIAAQSGPLRVQDMGVSGAFRLWAIDWSIKPN